MAVGQARLRVLVVENEMLLKIVAEELLVELGHEPAASASTAEGAVAEAERTRPDVVLMDIQLDGTGDGIDAAHKIRDRLNIVSLFATGDANAETRKRALMTRPLGYLLKPLTLNKLKAALDGFARDPLSTPPMLPPQSIEGQTSLPTACGDQPSSAPNVALQMTPTLRSEPED